MLKDNKGLTLIEMMICLVIFGILLQAMLSLFSMQLKVSRRIKLQQEAIYNKPNVVNLASVDSPVDGKALLCLSSGQSHPCNGNSQCEFVNGQWKRQNQVCDSGILYTK